MPAAVAKGPEAAVDVFLIPLDDFDFQVAASLAKSLTSDLKIYVKPTVNMGIAGLAPLPGTTQFSEEDIVTNVLRIIPNLKEARANAAYIALTTRDINTKDRTLRFNFCFYDKPARVAVVSAARLSIGNNGLPADRQTALDRLTKLIKRSLGAVYFDYPRSTDIRDVMYSPLMSLDDLDRRGSEYKHPSP
jgi:predicted Zn-dependent protease